MESAGERYRRHESQQQQHSSAGAQSPSRARSIASAPPPAAVETPQAPTQQQQQQQQLPQYVRFYPFSKDYPAQQQQQQQQRQDSLCGSQEDEDTAEQEQRFLQPPQRQQAAAPDDDASVVLACARDVVDVHHDLVRERGVALAKLERCAELERRLEFLAERLTQRECELMMREAELMLQSDVRKKDDPSSSTAAASFTPVPPTIFSDNSPASASKSFGSPFRFEPQQQQQQQRSSVSVATPVTSWDTAERCRDELRGLRDLIAVENVEQRLRTSEHEQMLLRTIARLSTRVASHRSGQPLQQQQQMRRRAPILSPVPENETRLVSPIQPGTAPAAVHGAHQRSQRSSIDEGIQTSPRFFFEEEHHAAQQQQQRHAAHHARRRSPTPDDEDDGRGSSVGSLPQRRLSAHAPPPAYVHHHAPYLQHWPSTMLTDPARRQQQHQQQSVAFSAAELSRRYQDYEPSPPRRQQQHQQQRPMELMSPSAPLASTPQNHTLSLRDRPPPAAFPRTTAVHEELRLQQQQQQRGVMRDAETYMSPQQQQQQQEQQWRHAEESAAQAEEAYNEQWISRTCDDFRRGSIIESVCLLTDLISGRSWYCSVFLLRRAAVPHLPELQLPSCVRCTLFVEDVIDAQLLEGEFAVTVKMRTPPPSSSSDGAQQQQQQPVDRSVQLLNQSQQLEASPARLAKAQNFAGVPCSIARAFGEQHLKIECETRIEARTWLELFALSLVEQRVVNG